MECFHCKECGGSGCPDCDAGFFDEDYDEWDVLVDTDPLELRDRARALDAENKRLRAEVDRIGLLYIEATNPGIDMDDVRRIRAEQIAKS